MAKAENGGASAPAYRVGRELGKRVMRSFAAIREPNELVVVQRFAAGANPALVRSDGVITLGVDAMNQLLRDADCLARNWHPNVARVKHVDGDAVKLAIATDFVDGMTLGDLFARSAGSAGPLLPYAVIVRVLVDVLAGLTALHALRDGTRAAGTIHGALSPANIVVGRDGVARIISCLRPRPVRVAAGAEALPYAAPEALDEGGTKDARADVYAVGVILWHALVGKAPYEASDPVQLLARQRAEEVATAPVDASSPFAALGEIAARAMAFEPSLRYRTTAEMATALRKLAGAEIAAGTAVAAKVAELAGDRIRARRAELDPKAAPKRRAMAPAPAPVSPVAPVARPVTAKPVVAAIEESTPAVATDLEPAPITSRGERAAEVVVAAKPAPVVLAPPLPRPAPPVLAPPLPPVSPIVLLIAEPIRAEAASPLPTPAAAFRPSVEPPSRSASEAPPSRQRRNRAAVLLLLGAALVILLVAGARSMSGRDDLVAPPATAGTAATTVGEPLAAPEVAEPIAPAAAAAPTPTPVATSGDVVPSLLPGVPVKRPAFNAAPRPAIKKTYDPLGI